MGRQHADEEGGDRHRGDRQGQRRLAADAIPDMAEDDAAEGPHEIAGGEHAEGGEKRGERVVGGEELPPENGGEESVNREIVPFHDIADGAGDDGAPGLRRFWRHEYFPPRAERPAGRVAPNLAASQPARLR